MNTKGTDPDGGQDAGTPQQQAAQKAQIKKAVEDINRRANNSEAIFGVHEETNRVTIKIVDKQTKEERLEALSKMIADGVLGERKVTEEVNNHIHTYFHRPADKAWMMKWKYL